MSALDTIEGLAEEAGPLLAKWGPILMPLVAGLESGKISKELIVELGKMAMTKASDEQMRSELEPR